MRKALGEIEHLILLAILWLGDEAYGVAIVDEIADRCDRELSVAATYVALRRLESKGYVAGCRGAPTPLRGGRAKRYFSVTPLGLQRLEDSANAIFRMWENLDPALRGGNGGD